MDCETIDPPDPIPTELQDLDNLRGNERRAAQRNLYLLLEQHRKYWLQAGDRQQADRIHGQMQALFHTSIEENLGLNRAGSSDFIGNGSTPTDDILQSGSEGLMLAWLSWDPAKGTLSTWSRSFISGCVRREVAKEFSGRSYADWCARPLIDKTERELIAKARADGRVNYTPTHAEVAEKSGKTVDLVRRVREQRELRLDAPVGSSEDGSATLSELLEAHSSADDSVMEREQVVNLLVECTRPAVQRAEDQLFHEADAAGNFDYYPSDEEVAARCGRPLRLVKLVRSTPMSNVQATRDAVFSERVLRELEPSVEREYWSLLFETVDIQGVWRLVRGEGLDGAEKETFLTTAESIGAGREKLRRAEQPNLQKILDHAAETGLPVPQWVKDGAATKSAKSVKRSNSADSSVGNPAASPPGITEEAELAGLLFL